MREPDKKLFLCLERPFPFQKRPIDCTVVLFFLLEKFIIFRIIDCASGQNYKLQTKCSVETFLQECFCCRDFINSQLFSKLFFQPTNVSLFFFFFLSSPWMCLVLVCLYSLVCSLKSVLITDIYFSRLNMPTMTMCLSITLTNFNLFQFNLIKLWIGNENQKKKKCDRNHFIFGAFDIDWNCLRITNFSNFPFRAQYAH